MKLQKAYPSDFEKIYPLLLEFHSSISRDRWKRLFTYSWKRKEKHIGWYLEDNNTVVGFLSFIFSEREIDGITHGLCNTSSWIIKKEYRNHFMLFISEILALDEHTVTILSPNKQTYNLLSRYGFQDLNTSVRIFFNGFSFILPSTNICVIKGDDLIEILSDQEKTVITDHKGYACYFMYLKHNSEHCLIGFKLSSQIKFGLRFIKVHVIFISHINFFKNNLIGISRYMMRKFGVLSLLYIENRYQINSLLLPHYTRKNWVSTLFRSKMLSTIQVDYLYSEQVLI